MRFERREIVVAQPSLCVCGFANGSRNANKRFAARRSRERTGWALNLGGWGGAGVGEGGVALTPAPPGKYKSRTHLHGAPQLLHAERQGFGLIARRVSNRYVFI